MIGIFLSLLKKKTPGKWCLYSFAIACFYPFSLEPTKLPLHPINLLELPCQGHQWPPHYWMDGHWSGLTKWKFWSGDLTILLALPILNTQLSEEHSLLIFTILLSSWSIYSSLPWLHNSRKAQCLNLTLFPVGSILMLIFSKFFSLKLYRFKILKPQSTSFLYTHPPANIYH